MEKARDDYPGSRTMPEEEEEPIPTWPPALEYDTFRQTDIARKESRSSNQPSTRSSEVWVMLRGGYTLVPDTSIDAGADINIAAGADLSENLALFFSAGLKVAKPRVDSALSASVQDSLYFLKADVTGRYLPLQSWVIFSPYFSAGIGCFEMGWTFRNPITSGDDVIRSDSIRGFFATVGGGIYLLNLEHLRIGLCASPELYLFGTVTQEGFDNDYFSAFGSVVIRAEIAVLF